VLKAGQVQASVTVSTSNESRHHHQPGGEGVEQTRILELPVATANGPALLNPGVLPNQNGRLFRFCRKRQSHLPEQFYD
jgi:hypothetical protein